MEAIPTAAVIKAEADRVGLSIAELCRRTGSAPTTFYRWQAGDADPKIGTVRAWMAAIHAVKRETAA